jgi:hypothetical protein
MKKFYDDRLRNFYSPANIVRMVLIKEDAKDMQNIMHGENNSFINNFS